MPLVTTKPKKTEHKSRVQTSKGVIKVLHSPERQLYDHVLFFPTLVVVLILWMLYRAVFSFPVWFDETIGKAFFFGLPVWFYVVTSKRLAITASFDRKLFEPGVLLGLALGGMYGFVTSIASLVQTGAVVQAVGLFNSSLFWYEFVLAIFTGFWETLFFFSFVATVIFQKYQKWPALLQWIGVALIFLIFHLPNTLLRFSGIDVASQLFILGLFGLGQTLIFYRWRNAYTLVLSHAIWGLVLLFYAG